MQNSRGRGPAGRKEADEARLRAMARTREHARRRKPKRQPQTAAANVPARLRAEIDGAGGRDRLRGAGQWCVHSSFVFGLFGVPVGEDLLCCEHAWAAGDTAARVGPRAALVVASDRRPVVVPARGRPVEEQLRGE